MGQEIGGEDLLVDLLQRQHVRVEAQQLLQDQRLPVVCVQVPAASQEYPEIVAYSGVCTLAYLFSVSASDIKGKNMDYILVT